ncbi:MAG: aldose epimerase family protein [Alphaproteobacteria bacterium]
MNGGASAVVRLESAGAAIEVAHRGAELKRWQMGGRDWLHDGAPDWWERTAPLLFPVVGKSRGDQVRIDGQAYPMPMHGFAAAQRFQLVDATGETALFRLTDNEATRRHFPYGFQLEIQYRLGALSISLDARIVNSGDGAMPVAFGTHPAFVWPLPGGEGQPHKVAFDDDVGNLVPRITADGLFCHETQPVAMTGRDLWLGQGECFSGRALCFLGDGTTGVRFGPENGPTIGARGTGFRHLALWSKPGAPFLSIEHWTAHGEDVDADCGLAERREAIMLQPGEDLHVGTVYEIEPRAGNE